MANCAKDIAITASQQASRILKAWMSQDEAALQSEFEKGMGLCRDDELSSLEGEHMELLQTLLGRLHRNPGFLCGRASHPAIHLCIDLLTHLAGRERAPESAGRAS